MANLSASELIKPGREYRAGVIVKKIKNKEPFELSNGSKVVFAINKKIITILSKELLSSAELNGIRFLGEDGEEYKLSDIKKNSEFGGKGERSTVAKEDAALSSLNEQLIQIKKDTKTASVPIKVKNKVYKIDYAESTPGTPKSDFHLVDMDGKEVIWISHKDGRTAKDFQQWGGISQRSEPTVFSHTETQKFINDLKNQYKNGLPPATTLYRKIKDSKLKMLSVYGNEYGKNMSRQNVSVLLQGPIKLAKSGSSYIFQSNHVHYNGDSVDGDGFDPVLMAIYKGDRSDAGIKGTRIVISPIGGRKGTEYK